MSGHTKGIWRADDSGKGEYSIVALRDGYVVELGHIDDQCDANLVAAAPDLFAALKIAIEYLRKDDGSNQKIEDFQKCRRAIRKALGQ